MVRKTVGYVYMQWTCPRCETKNPGPQKFCNGCGGPQPEDVEFEQLAQEELIKDEAEIARAKAGPDVHCPYCEARNPGNAKFCGECGGDLSGAKTRETGRVVGAHRAGPAEEIQCPSCGTPNPADNQRCANCGSSLVVEKPQMPTSPPLEKARTSRKFGIGGIGIAVAVVCLFAAALYFLFGRTEDLQGIVRDVTWTRTIPIEAIGPVEHEGWYDEIPNDAELGDCRLEHHHTQSVWAPDSTEVCGTPYTVDTGTGIGEVVQDCEYEIYENMCTYTMQEWTTVTSVIASGFDFNPSWPDVSLQSGQRQGDGEETYEVVFDTDKKDYKYTTTDLVEFTQFKIGSKWTLAVNTIGTLVSVEPAK